MNIAIILAGGSGERMKTKAVPKQFLLVAGKPIIVYTLEKFQESPLIDSIIIVCREDFKNETKRFINQFGITKTVSIVSGDKTRHGSLYNGVKEAVSLSKHPEEDIVLIHDAVRPAVSLKLISDIVEQARIHDACMAVGQPIETIVIIGEDRYVKEVKDRKICRTGKAPHAYKLSLISAIFEKSRLDGNLNYIDDESMMYAYQVPIFTIDCPDENIKITNKMDYIVFRSFIWDKEDSQFQNENE